jgi:hypothetical protein
MSYLFLSFFPFFLSFFFFFNLVSLGFLETGSHYGAQAGLKVNLLLPLLLQCWDYKCVPEHLTHEFFILFLSFSWGEGVALGGLNSVLYTCSADTPPFEQLLPTQEFFILVIL